MPPALLLPLRVYSLPGYGQAAAPSQAGGLLDAVLAPRIAGDVLEAAACALVLRTLGVGAAGSGFGRTSVTFGRLGAQTQVVDAGLFFMSLNKFLFMYLFCGLLILLLSDYGWVYGVIYKFMGC